MYSRPVKRRNQRTSRLKSFPAAVAGWVSNQNLADPSSSPQGAAMLENILPLATGGIVRRGTLLYATLNEDTIPVRSLFSYVNGANRHLFAANDTTIYDITAVVTPDSYSLVTEDMEAFITDGGDLIGNQSTYGLDVVRNQTGGYWVARQFATTGGIFLVCVNGENELELYDGSRFFPISENDIYTLNFDAQTAAFTAGANVTGSSSTATGTILYVTGDGTTGTLVLLNLSGGPFTDNETITDTTGGSATVDGGESVLFTSIDGIETSRLSYVWAYKNRLFFVEKDSMTAWYLPVDQVTGTLTALPLGGNFGLGGSLLFGSNWSTDTGDQGGLSEQCVFVTTEGEVAVYQGNNPSDASAWSRVGTYRIGKPLGSKAWIRGGGDLIVDTDLGRIPLSAAIQRDVAALAPSAVSYPIEPDWNKAVEFRSGAQWHTITWSERQMVVTALPTINDQPAMMFITNARTGAWAAFTGWDGTCLEVFNGRLFFGSQNGKVIEAYVTGLDEGKPYTATYVPLFEDFGSPASLKVTEICRAVTRGPYDGNPSLSVMEDYIISLSPPPAAAVIPTGNQWDAAIWGQAIWGDEKPKKIQQEWDSVAGTGYALAPCYRVTSGSLIPLDTEIIRLDLTYSVSEIIT